MTLARIFICDSKDPSPKYDRFRHDGIRFYKCFFPKGAYQTYRYPEAIKYSELPSCHIHLSGIMIEPTGTWPDQTPGWMSREEQFVIPKGVWTREAATDCMRWCCTGVSNGEPTDYVTTVRARDPFILSVGESFLIASGKLKIGMEYYEPPMCIKALSRDQLLRPISTVYGFKWRSADVFARYPMRVK